jgi:hypothetical protein
LLEGLLVLAATALVAALGVAALRTYLIRGEITASIELAKHARDQVTRAFRRTGTPPADNAAAHLPGENPSAAGRYVAETKISDGRIDLVFGAEASEVLHGKVLSLTPFETADQEVVWVCGSKAPGVGLQPLGFAGGGPVAVQASTTVEARYLPPACR